MIRGVVLDVNETLFSLDALNPVFSANGLDERDRDLWFARTLRDGFALTMAGSYSPFPEVAANSFLSMGAASATELMDAFSRLEPHPDVRAGLELLQAKGIPAVTLSVGDHHNVERLFARAGLADYVTTHLSCAMAEAWKPARAPYELACQTLVLEPHEVVMIAAHSWDLAGARAVGLRTGWIERLERTPQRIFGTWDIQGFTLSDVVEQISSVR